MSTKETEKDAELLELLEIVESWCRRARTEFVPNDADPIDRIKFLAGNIEPLTRSLNELLEHLR